MKLRYHVYGTIVEIYSDVDRNDWHNEVYDNQQWRGYKVL